MLQHMQEIDQRNKARVERWFAEIWNSVEKYPISLNSSGPHGGPVWEWLGWSEKAGAWKKYQNSIPAADYALLADDGKFVQMTELSRGKGFDVLLTANGFDHALLNAPGKHGQHFRQLFIDIKNKVWKARREKARGGARFMKSEAQKVATEVAIACGRSLLGKTCRALVSCGVKSQLKCECLRRCLLATKSNATVMRLMLSHWVLSFSDLAGKSLTESHLRLLLKKL